MKKEHYNVNGLANEEMKTQVKNVCVDLARGTVEVAYNNPATSQEIKKCIENTGHEVE